MPTNIMFVGVGGQGTLLASKILGRVLIEKGYDVKVSEVHGMSQRGGSVVTYVRYGDKVYSPTVEAGEADIILAFEQLEALRSLSCLAPQGTLIVNTQTIEPMTVITGSAAYPQDIIPTMEATGAKIVAADALAIATECGTAKAVNIVLLGIAAKRLGLAEEDFFPAIDALVKEKFRDVNKAAFSRGYALG